MVTYFTTFLAPLYCRALFVFDGIVTLSLSSPFSCSRHILIRPLTWHGLLSKLPINLLRLFQLYTFMQKKGKEWGKNKLILTRRRGWTQRRAVLLHIQTRLTSQWWRLGLVVCTVCGESRVIQFSAEGIHSDWFCPRHQHGAGGDRALLPQMDR